MLDLITEASALGALLEETRGVVGVVLAPADGEPRAIVGHVDDDDTSATVGATLTGELNKIGAVLGLGTLGVASLKAGTAARVFAQQSGAVVVIELDPKRPLGELETKLRTVAWAPEEDLLEVPKSHRMPTVPSPPPRLRPSGLTPPPPITGQAPATLPPQLQTVPPPTMPS